MNNFWRHVRLAGITLMCVGSWAPSVQLILWGTFALLVGITLGLNRIEDRLNNLEKGDPQ